ncbi:MAG TPA: hypothetical protein DD670_09845, partial [Planctomycetaceae bacterium]|nr:hypothetical protein [Planctomycetaceae bacterium]
MRRPIVFAAYLSTATLLVLAVASADACTSIMVGKKASLDGSVLTSHTNDSHRGSSVVLVTRAAEHAPGSMRALTKRRDDDTGPMPRWARVATGQIPQVPKTYG